MVYYYFCAAEKYLVQLTYQILSISGRDVSSLRSGSGTESRMAFTIGHNYHTLPKMAASNNSA